MIVLIKSEEPVISDYVVQGQLKEDAAVYSYILSQCAESAGMDTKQLEKMSYRYIISEVDYPKTFYRIVKNCAVSGICNDCAFDIGAYSMHILPMAAPTNQAYQRGVG